MTPQRAAWFVLGVSALGLGILGVVVPLLPTTPFILLAAFAFSRSSER
ncbi:MAG: YbaN family protein, partial [Alphaproteobacteria bacterium]|nr:YbaN family protein [Alphaproteobacteria bacterium]